MLTWEEMNTIVMLVLDPTADLETKVPSKC